MGYNPRDPGQLAQSMVVFSPFYQVGLSQSSPTLPSRASQIPILNEQ